MPEHKLSTRLVHAGEPRPRIGGAIAAPIFQTSTYETGDEAAYHEVRYHRLNNSPNHAALAGKLASVCGAEAACVCASGMAAISTALLAVLSAGDHALVQGGVYGGTQTLFSQDLPRLGISHSLIDGADPSSWATALTPATRVLYLETITNPLLTVPDLEAAVAFARVHGLVSVIDNTFATPVNLRPAELGFDLVLHSATKYLNGHSDLVCGAILGRAALIERTLHTLNHLGGCLSPHGCFLLHRGLKTLAVRVRAQCAGALALARALEAHPAVARVRYPGLASHPQHARAARLFAGFGGVLSFELRGGVAAVDAMIERLTLPIYAPSLGGVETLITLPARTTHLGMTPAERAAVGVTDSLTRVSVGLEDPDDLIADFRRALG